MNLLQFYQMFISCVCVSEEKTRSEIWKSYHLQTELKRVEQRNEKKIKQGQRDKEQDLTGLKNTRLGFHFIGQRLNIQHVFEEERDLTCPEPED